MPSFRIHRLKDHLRANFRLAPHLSGMASVKPRDYEFVEDQEPELVEASTPYAAFFALKDSERPLQVGDLLACEDGSLKIFKFVGIEEAEWVLPEIKVEAIPVQPEAVGASV